MIGEKTQVMQCKEKKKTQSEINMSKDGHFCTNVVYFFRKVKVLFCFCFQCRTTKMPVPTTNATTSDPSDLREANMQLDAVAVRILELSQVNYRSS